VLIGIGRILVLILTLLPFLLILILVPKKFFWLAVPACALVIAMMAKFPLLGRIFVVLNMIMAAVAVILVIALNRDEKVLRRGSRIPLTPLDLWLNAAGSCLSAANNADTQRLMVHFAGTPGSGLRKMAIRRTLKNNWGITSPDTAIAEMFGLLTVGTRARFQMMMERQEAKGEVTGPDSGPAHTQSNLPVGGPGTSLQSRLLDAWRRRGANALLGWDLGRLACNAQYCFLAGYLSREELTALGTAAYELAQKHCLGWEDLMESYLLGFQFWCGEDENVPGSQSARRREVYEKLRKERPSIYEAVPWTLSAME